MATKKKLISVSSSKKKATVKKDSKKTNSKTTKPVKSKKRKSLNIILSLLMLVGISVMTLLVVFCVYIVIEAPEFDTDLLYSKEASIFYDKDGNEIGRVGAEQRELKYYEDLPEVLIDAIVATEDSRFFQHNGFDVVRFTKASFGQIAGNRNAGGASTLTMQVVKNTFTSREASGFKGIIRKFTDIYMSVFLVERNYTKEEIIEFYVNEPFLGNNTYGVEQACQTYFGKSVSDLTLTEAALIAGIFNAPSNYNPFYNTELATQRRAVVLDLMVRHGYITEEQADDAKAIPVESLTVERTGGLFNKYQVFIDTAADEVLAKTGYDPYSVPMEVYTTMDPRVQDVFVALNNGTLGYKWKKDWIEFGGIITDVKDGSIRGVNGGRELGARLYNRATDMKTQPGSTAKPIFAYGPYIEFNNGNTGTVFYDNKMTYSNGQVLTNADNSYLGALTMRDALARSRNIPAVQAFQAVDKNKIAKFANACGIDYYRYNRDGTIADSNLYESYAIGGGLAVSPKDMAGAYGTFARGGYYIEPYSFTKVVFLETDDVYEHKYTKTQSMSPETAYMITDILITATKRGVGGKINVSGSQIASKTGTSTYDSRALKEHGVPSRASADNWVITYSPDYVISFWYGVDKLTTKEKFTDSTDAAIERKKISALVANKVYKKNSKFTKPSGVVSAKMEFESNPAELPSEFTPSSLISTQLFKKGTEPSEISERFARLDNPTGGSYREQNGVITLSWYPISKPNAINETYLKNFFEENTGRIANTAYNKRIEYNKKNVGDLGYQVYLSTVNGLQPLGYTTNSYYSYSVGVPGTYTFVIKSTYSIFKANASTGLEITTSSTVDNNDSNDQQNGLN